MADYLSADPWKTRRRRRRSLTLDEGVSVLLNTSGQSTDSRQIERVEDDMRQRLKKLNSSLAWPTSIQGFGCRKANTAE